MDLHERVTIEALRVSAPRSFDKVLLDLLLAVQEGARPIVGDGAVVVAARQADDPAPAGPDWAALSDRLDQVVAHLKQHEADILQLQRFLEHHTHETIREVA